MLTYAAASFALQRRASVQGLRVPELSGQRFVPKRAGNVHMAIKEEFGISREVKAVRVFDGDYATEICKEVESVAKMCIEEKGSFSLAIPGGSVVEAVKGLDTGALDMSKVHIFLVNEKVPSYPCAKGAQEVAEKWGLPK